MKKVRAYRQQQPTGQLYESRADDRVPECCSQPRARHFLCRQSLGICIFFMVIAMAVSAASNLLVAAGMWTALAWLGIVGVSYLGLQVCFAGRLRQPEKAPEC